MKVGFAYPVDGLMPLTIWYQEFCNAIRRHPDFTEQCGPTDLAIPAEDTALEHLWPRYYSPGEEFIRGVYNREFHTQYLLALAQTDAPMCILNMHSQARMHEYMTQNPHIIVADITLSERERALNPRSISMPGMPLTVGSLDLFAKTRLCTFRGMNSHPVRVAMMELNAHLGFFCELVDPSNHYGQLDAQKNKTDQAFVNLMNESLFALVPRGDALYSYRLLEALSFGCIPIVLSDGWVLPFDRVVPWSEIALHVPEAEVATIPARIAALSPDQIRSMLLTGARIYAEHFSGFDAIVRTLLTEARMILEGHP